MTGINPVTLHDGRVSISIVPIAGGTTFPREALVEPGDSSAPVLDKDGVVGYGHVSALRKSVLCSCIVQGD
jgi:hypothetical protein